MLEIETQLAVLVVSYSFKGFYLQMLLSNSIHFFLCLSDCFPDKNSWIVFSLNALNIRFPNYQLFLYSFQLPECSVYSTTGCSNSCFLTLSKLNQQLAATIVFNFERQQMAGKFKWIKHEKNWLQLFPESLIWRQNIYSICFLYDWKICFYHNWL